MMQVSTREEDENELSLELSIGRKCYDKKTSTSQMLPRDFAPNRNIITSIISPQSQLHGDLQFKQALRRKKRDEKRGKGENACCVDEIEEEEEAEMPPRKKEKCLSFNNISPHDNNVVSNLKIKMNREAALPAMQYVPFTNGFVYPPPCTNGFSMDNNRTRGNYEALDKRVSFDIRSFRPYSSSCRNLEMTSTVVNDASSGGSSPAVSDHHTSTLQGGSSSISFQHESRNVFSAGNGSKRSEIKNWDSMGMCSNEVKVRTKANHTVNTTLISNIQVRESRCSEEPKPAATLEDPTLSTKNPVDSALLKKNTSNAVITNPLKTQIECNGPSALPQMPCVSTTGNGPNGKTITGFLYKYTKTEVCIVCVCHGTSFSPADFVKHAGGVDVEHPLRHITIVSSDLT